MPAAKLAKKPYNIIVWEFIIMHITKKYSYGYIFIMMNIYITMIYYLSCLLLEYGKLIKQRTLKII